MPQTCSADFHIHGLFSGATSDKMVFDRIAEQAVRKGLDFVGTGDILHLKWRERLEESLEKVAEGTYMHPEHGVRFVPTVEVEDEDRVHHVILAPSMSKVDELREAFSPFSDDMNIDGRPTLDLAAPRIAEIAAGSGCLIGPSHAFTPWTSVYKEFDSLTGCYEDQVGNVDFLELGLSADTFMADRISELRDLTFLSNSDAHSPWPNKLGREFNRFELSEPTCRQVLSSVEAGEGLTLNVGLDPELGKYHLTACSKCHERFSIEEAEGSGWECDECGGSVKKGVSDRVDELSDFAEPRHPDFRPDYVHVAPLSEVISLAWDGVNPRSGKVQGAWEELVGEFDDEISVLIDVPIPRIKEAVDPAIGEMISHFRKGELDVSPGGGGEYGELELPSKVINARKKEDQKRLSDFGV